jgi:protein gp37
MKNSKISWTDHSFNPWLGCTRVSEGCRNCYAASLVGTKFKLDLWGDNKERQVTKTWDAPRKWHREASARRTLVLLGPASAASVTLRQSDILSHASSTLPLTLFEIAGLAGCTLTAVERLVAMGRLVRVGQVPLSTLRRPRVFCASLADVFDGHESLPPVRAELWKLVRKCSELDWLILTKRPQNIEGMLPPDWGAGWENVWLGTSVEDLRVAQRVDILRKVPATAPRFISYEPALGPLHEIPSLDGISWVIYGGESGKGYRPADPQWARDMRDRCARDGVTFFHKQSSSFRSGCGVELDGKIHFEWPQSKLVQLGIPSVAASAPIVGQSSAVVSQPTVLEVSPSAAA